MCGLVLRQYRSPSGRRIPLTRRTFAPLEGALLAAAVAAVSFRLVSVWRWVRSSRVGFVVFFARYASSVGSGLLAAVSSVWFLWLRFWCFFGRLAAVSCPPCPTDSYIYRFPKTPMFETYRKCNTENAKFKSITYRPEQGADGRPVAPKHTRFNGANPTPSDSRGRRKIGVAKKLEFNIGILRGAVRFQL